MPAHLPCAERRLRMDRLVRTNLALLIMSAIAVVGSIAAVAQTETVEREVVSLTGTHSDLQFLAGRSRPCANLRRARRVT